LMKLGAGVCSFGIPFLMIEAMDYPPCVELLRQSEQRSLIPVGV